MTARRLFSVLPFLLLAGCFTDAATRLAYDLEEGSKRLGTSSGERAMVVHRTPSKEGECVASYKVQVDDAGAIIIWCYDANGAETVSSHSTSYHSRYVDTPRTYILDKGAAEPLLIELERQGSRAVIVDVT
jgi:hypothetical protein